MGGTYYNELLGCVGKPGPFLPIDTRQFQYGITNAPVKLYRSSSAHSTLGASLFGGGKQKMYSAGSVPNIDADWHYQARKAEAMAARGAGGLSMDLLPPPRASRSSSPRLPVALRIGENRAQGASGRCSAPPSV